jgi:hypothetical protein
VGTRHYCDGCGYDDDPDLYDCAGECFYEYCDECLKSIGDKRYCVQRCYDKERAKIPGGQWIGTPLLEPKPIVEFVFPPVEEEAVA